MIFMNKYVSLKGMNQAPCAPPIRWSACAFEVGGPEGDSGLSGKKTRHGRLRPARAHRRGSSRRRSCGRVTPGTFRKSGLPVGTGWAYLRETAPSGCSAPQAADSAANTLQGEPLESAQRPSLFSAGDSGTIFRNFLKSLRFPLPASALR